MLADNLDVVIGKNLRNLRSLRGFSQQKLGKEIDVTFQQIQKYESGKNRISASTMIALARTLKVSIMDFFMGLDGQGENNPLLLDTLDKDTMQLIHLFNLLRNEKTKNAVLSLLKNQVQNQDKMLGT